MIWIWCLFPLGLPAVAARMRLEARADYTKCSTNNAFSCPAKSECVPTTSDNSTVICCPDTSGCRIIQPLTCDISQQDVARFPDNLVHTTNLTATLPACGSGCCPLGYDCQSGNCVLALIPPASPTSTLPASTPSSPLSTQPPSSSTDAPAASETSQPASEQGHKSNLPLALGLSFGLIGALVAILLILWCLKRRKRAKASYVSQSYGARDNQSVADFMGTTPRPDSERPRTPPRQPMHERKISGPITDPSLAGDGAIHRTDFILGQRGSVQTGWERQQRPSWSNSSKNRPKSRLIPRSSHRSSATEMASPESGRVQVFNHPLRFGLPLKPKLSDTPNIGLSRSPTGEEKLATLKDIGGRTVPSGAVVRVDNHTPSPSRAKKYEIKPRDRSKSQRRPLVTDDSPVAHDSPFQSHMTTPQRGRSPPRGRVPSDATTASFETGSINSEKESDSRRVTMNVMLPPASVFRTPPPTAHEHRVRDDEMLNEDGNKRMTTFDDLMRRAGSQRR